VVKAAFSVLSVFYPLLVLALLRFFGGSSLGSLLKLYPLIMNVAFLVSFGLSLFYPPTQVFKLALLSDSSIRNSMHLPAIESYCHNVTKVWCVFFVVNALICSYTIWLSPDWVWALYNGCIAYIIMGIIFAVEWLVRRKVKKSFA